MKTMFQQKLHLSSLTPFPSQSIADCFLLQPGMPHVNKPTLLIILQSLFEGFYKYSGNNLACLRIAKSLPYGLIDKHPLVNENEACAASQIDLVKNISKNLEGEIIFG